MNNKYLISGSHGFIGSALGASLLKDGNTVRSIPRDILEDDWNLIRFLQDEQPDYIIHLASYGNHYNQKDFAKTIEVNFGLTIKLLLAASTIPIKGFINFSTSSVHLPVQTAYSTTKKAIEEIIPVYAREFHTKVITIRPYSVYGVGEAEFRFIPTVIRSAKYGVPLSVAEKPEHDWIYIDDFVNGVKSVIQAPHLPSSAIDIGNGVSFSNKEIVQTIEKIHGKKIPYAIVESLRSYDTDKWVCDLKNIKSTGWRAKTTLIEGLKKTYDYY